MASRSMGEWKIREGGRWVQKATGDASVGEPTDGSIAKVRDRDVQGVKTWSIGRWTMYVWGCGVWENGRWENGDVRNNNVGAE